MGLDIPYLQLCMLLHLGCIETTWSHYMYIDGIKYGILKTLVEII